jgi:NhaP-type Na+/H+ or K+/H+ antiporter
MPLSPLPSLVVIVVLGVFSAWLAWRLRLPSILLLLLAGLIAGPITHLLDPDALFGDLMLPFVSLSVGLILYEGGLTLRFRELAAVGRVVRNLVTIGALVTLMVSAVAARLIFGMPWPLAVLLGAILIVTGPTVIAPLLRHIRPGGSVGAILKWEAIVIDPMGAMVAVLVFEALLVGRVEQAAAAVALGIVKTIVIGGGLGVFSALLLVHLLARYWVPDYLQNAVSLMLVVATQAAANLMQHESGLLAVTVMGMVLANQRRVDVRHIVEFKENLQVLLISVLFVLLAARLDAAALQGKLLAGVLFVGVLVVIGRPLAVYASTIGAKLSRAEKLFITGMAPRGIVAAAVSAVFALRLQQAGISGASDLVPITFMVIIGTVALYSLAAPTVAYRLGVATPNPQGILFAGASSWTRELAAVLKDRGYRTLLVDTNHTNVRAARMAGLPAMRMSILADYALDELDLGGIGRFFAVTPNDWINTLAVQRFAGVFGRRACYQLAAGREAPAQAEQHRHLHGRRLFGDELTFATIAQRMANGATIKVTPLTAEFRMEEFRSHYADAVLLLLIAESGRIIVSTQGEPLKPQPGHLLVSLVNGPRAKMTNIE